MLFRKIIHIFASSNIQRHKNMNIKTIDLKNLKKNAAIVKAFKWYVSDDSGDMYTLVFHSACQLGVTHKELAESNDTDSHDIIGAGYIYFDKVMNCVVIMGGSKEFGILPQRAWCHDINNTDVANTLKELIPLWNEKTGDNIGIETNFSYADVYVTNYSLEEIIEEKDIPKRCNTVYMTLE